MYVCIIAIISSLASSRNQEYSNENVFEIIHD